MAKHLRTDYELLESSSVENRRLLRQEELILAVTEALSESLLEKGITKRELAERLGKSKGFVSQLFAGGRNLTLRTVADLADALDSRITVQVVPVSTGQSIQIGTLGNAASWQSSERPQFETVVVPFAFTRPHFLHEGAA